MPTVKAHLADATALDGTEEGTEDLGLVDAIALAITLHSYAIHHRDAYRTVGTRLSSSRFRTIHPRLLVISRSSLRHLSVGRPV